MLEDKVFLRPVRSYVRRESRMSNRQQSALEILWHIYGIEYSDQMINFTELFGRTAPIVLEIGFGMGKSLLAMALANPDINYLGIEVHRPGVGALLAELSEHNIQNVKIMCHDAKEVMETCIPDQVLAKVQIFFPDPWPKKRHHKRRLIQPEFATLITKKLVKDGMLHMATDCQDYAEQMNEVAKNIIGFVNVAGEHIYMNGRALRPVTKYEERGFRLGNASWDLLFQKTN